MASRHTGDTSKLLSMIWILPALQTLDEITGPWLMALQYSVSLMCQTAWLRNIEVAGLSPGGLLLCICKWPLFVVYILTERRLLVRAPCHWGPLPPVPGDAPHWGVVRVRRNIHYPSYYRSPVIWRSGGIGILLQVTIIPFSLPNPMFHLAACKSIPYVKNFDLLSWGEEVALEVSPSLPPLFCFLSFWEGITQKVFYIKCFLWPALSSPYLEANWVVKSSQLYLSPRSGSLS